MASLYTTSIPTKTDAGTYYVWYKVIGDANHSDLEPAMVQVVISANATPAFAGYTLRLGGVLGLNYYMELPEGFDGTGARMTFTIEGNTQTVAFSAATAETNGGRSYKVFPCNVHAYQMAETITAVFSYGESQSVTKEYSVKQYLDSVTEGQYGGDAKTLVTAARAYGHFIQPYLHDVNGTSHANMDYSGDAGVAAARTGAAAYAMRCGTLESGSVASVRYYLTISASTTLNVVIETTSDVEEGSVSVTLDGTACSPAVSGNTYRVTVPNIAANNLGVAHAFEMKVGGRTVFSLDASAISFVNTVLTKSNPTANEQNAMAALYHYFQAAQAYAQNPDS